MHSEAEIRALIVGGETQNVEFKESTAGLARIRKTLCAFANDWAETGGGVLLVGVRDDGEVIGVENPDEVQRALGAACRDGMNPPVAADIYPVQVGDKRVVVCRVVSGANRPHQDGGACYIRIGSETRTAVVPEIEQLLRRRGPTRAVEDEPVFGTSVMDIAWDRFESYLSVRQRSEIRDPRPAEDVALSSGWLVNGQRTPSLAMLLLFGTRPHRFVTWAYVSFVRFEGLDRAAPMADRTLFEGDLVDVTRRCLQKINDLSLRAYEFHTTRPERTELHEYPAQVVREALVNAVVHRDYGHRSSGVEVRMFDDRLEVESPGGLFGKVTRDNFGRTTDYRNRHIADGFSHLARMTEMVGRGIPLIRQSMAENRSPEPKFEFFPDYILVTLPAQPVYQARRLYLKGTAALVESEFEQAVATLQRAVALAGQFAEVHVALAAAYRKQGRVDEAEEVLKRALQVDPGFAGTYVALAELYTLERRDDRMARTIVEQGARLSRRPADVLRYAARTGRVHGEEE